MQHEVIRTQDGSHTIRLIPSGATYHSMHGALTESRHVFIEHGLRSIHDEKSQLTIFEMGFGTGLNALLAMEYAKSHGITIDYISIEMHPLPASTYRQLNYCDLLAIDAREFQLMHDADWNSWQPITYHFNLLKVESAIATHHHEQAYDVVFYDAFGPGEHASAWQEAILSPLTQAMNQGAVLTTFCAQGAFKRTLRSLGMHVEALPGPPGKREMTRAIKA